ncbi:MAG: hypothetical protein QOE90_3732 [Thermoplasmata archaeon]|jgi:hypothetical protein|nr:hypothetical protein [Thermoplasmata archaeon]
MRLVLALALVLLVLAGCFSKDNTPAAYTIKATGGKVSPGWAYDGAGLAGGDATLEGYVRNADNAGGVFANFTYLGSKYQVIFDQFKQQDGKPFQDGGVAFGLTEHGDSGTADTSIPKVHGKVVAYGFAQILRDGKPFVGQAGNLWAAHLMVYDDAVRGPDGKITKKDGTSPFDPSAPADAKTYPGQAQAMLKLVHPDGMNFTKAPVHVDSNLTMSGPNGNQSVAIPVEAGALPFTITVNSTSAAPAGAPANVGVGTITVTIPVGKGYTDTGQVTPQAPYSKAFPLTAEDLSNVTSPITVYVTGSGVYNVEVTANVPYNEPAFLVVTWDNPTLS